MNDILPAKSRVNTISPAFIFSIQKKILFPFSL